MNIVIAGGIVSGPNRHGLHDLTAAELASAQSKAPTGVSGSSAGVNVGYAVSNVLNPPPGVGLGAAGALSIVSLLLPDPMHPAAQDHTMLWLPVRPGESLEKALAQADATYVESLMRVFHPQDRLETTTEQPLLGPVYQKTWRVGPDCPQGRCELATTLFQQHARHSGPLESIPAPPFLTAIRQVWGHPRRQGSATVMTSSAPWQSTLTDLQRFSAALPPWMYLYLAPRKDRNALPLVLNQGKTLYFIKPGDEAAVGLPAAGKPAG